MKEPCTISILRKDDESGIAQLCPICNSIVAQGIFAVQLTVSNDTFTIADKDDRITHCGNTTSRLVYNSMHAVQTAAKKLSDQLLKNTSTEGLEMYPLSPTGPSAN